MILRIDRKKWLRSEEDSCLIRSSDGKMCCLGFYAVELGIPRKMLIDESSPSDVENDYKINNQDWQWLVNQVCDYKNCSNIANKLMDTNDNRPSCHDGSQFSVEDQEARIAELFATQGIQVEFFN